MKTPFIKNPFLLRVLMAALGLMLPGATAQTLTTLRSFDEWDGFGPAGELVLSGSVLYGTTYSTVFAMNIDGSGFTNLHTFPQFSDLHGGLTLSKGVLYGTTSAGGTSNDGTVFALNTDGTGFTNLASLNPASLQVSGLLLSGRSLFGLSSQGGDFSNGRIFTVNTDGTGFTNLYSFSGGSDGRNPHANLVQWSNILYGVTPWGGSSNAGTLFAIHADGPGFTTLYTFTGGSEGGNPSSLVLGANKLFGTTTSGGSFGSGMVFSINLDGTECVGLHSFTGDSDGFDPEGRLLLAGTTLYGTTAGSAYTPSGGTLFALSTDGTGFTVLHRFTGGAEGRFPFAGVIASGNSLYGVTVFDGTFNFGTAFSISFSPQLALARRERNVVLSWPTNFAGFDYTGYSLQSTPNLALPVWTTNLPVPVIVNGQNTVTNPIAGTQQFFRLSQ